MKIAILAPFHDFASSYSLSHVVVGQAAGLRAAGHDVRIWCFDTVRPDFGVTASVADLVDPCIRPQKVQNDMTDAARSGAYAHDILIAIEKFSPDTIITHDVMFQAGYIDLARAVHSLADVHEASEARWFHYIHSVFGPDVSNASNWYRFRIPEGHSLIFPNQSNVEALARRYSVSRERVFTCPNPRDPRSFWNTQPLTANIVARYDVLSRDIVQVYPLCITRYVDKGLPFLVRLFNEMRYKANVLLVVADANSNTNDAWLARETLRGLAPRLGADDLVFLSEFDPQTRNSTPNSIVSELFRFSNLFVMPSRAEACPLVLAEAGMSGVHLVLNEGVPALREYAPPQATFFRTESGFSDFAYERQHTRTGFTVAGTEIMRRRSAVGDAASYLTQTANRILDSVRSNPVLAAKAFAFRTFNNDVVASKLSAILTTGAYAFSGVPA